MMYTVVWSGGALAAAQRFMADDPEGVERVFDATDTLETDPRPAGAGLLGANRLRIHVGLYRVIYEITDKTVTIDVIHLGRSGI